MTSNAVVLTAADAGSRRTIRVGDRVTVRLSENPTTGYRWESAADPHLLLVEDGFQGPTQPRGAEGDRVLVFEATQLGPASLRLVKRRAWGSPEPIAEYAAEFEVV